MVGETNYGRLPFNDRRPFNSAGVWGGAVSPPAGPEQHPDNNNNININNNIFRVSYTVTIKSQP